MKTKKARIMEEKERLVLSLEGKNEIELTTLTKSLDATLHCVNKIARSKLDKSASYTIYVKKIESGSVEIFLEILKIAVPAFVASVGVFTCLIEIWKTKKHLQGKLPKETKPLPNGNTNYKCERRHFKCFRRCI